VFVVDPGDGSVESDIDVGANPDGILITNGFAYVANSGFGSGNTVSVIDLSLNQEVIKTKVGDNPQWLELDVKGHVHVLCSGAYNDFNNSEDDTPGGVWVINPSDHAVYDSLIMEKGQHPSELSISLKGLGYFIYDAAILEYSTESLQVTDSTFIHMTDGFPYHIRVNEVSEELFITDAKDFVSPAEVIIFGMNGIEKTRHTVGIIPGYISFINIDEGPC
jgi:DNA-binding beta-propeller fold protein YncE